MTTAPDFTIKSDYRGDTGVPASPSGHSPKGGAATASPAKPSVPNAAHTPLPWGISYGFDINREFQRASYVAGPNPESVGIKLATPWIEGAWDNDPEADANAAFIVRACNSHYELVEALASLTRKYAAAWAALDYAHSEGFEWPTDPFGEEAMAFADPTVVPEYAALASAMSASGQDPKGLEAKPASAVGESRDAQGPSA